MKTRWQLFLGDSGSAIGYGEAIGDVRNELEKLILKSTPEGKNNEFKEGWNGALIALSKAIRIEQGRLGK